MLFLEFSVFRLTSFSTYNKNDSYGTEMYPKDKRIWSPLSYTMTNKRLANVCHTRHSFYP
jgi:hypothetical protein